MWSNFLLIKKIGHNLKQSQLQGMKTTTLGEIASQGDSKNIAHPGRNFPSSH